MLKQDLALNNQQWLVCLKTKIKQNQANASRILDM